MNSPQVKPEPPQTLIFQPPSSSFKFGYPLRALTSTGPPNPSIPTPISTFRGGPSLLTASRENAHETESTSIPPAQSAVSNLGSLPSPSVPTSPSSPFSAFDCDTGLDLTQDSSTDDDESASLQSQIDILRIQISRLQQQFNLVQQQQLEEHAANQDSARKRAEHRHRMALLRQEIRTKAARQSYNEGKRNAIQVKREDWWREHGEPASQSQLLIRHAFPFPPTNTTLAASAEAKSLSPTTPTFTTSPAFRPVLMTWTGRRILVSRIPLPIRARSWTRSASPEEQPPPQQQRNVNPRGVRKLRSILRKAGSMTTTTAAAVNAGPVEKEKKSARFTERNSTGSFEEL